MLLPLSLKTMLSFYVSFTKTRELMPNTTSTIPPDYTVPTTDLAHQVHKQIVVDKEEGQYLGHVSTVLLEDQQTIIAVYPQVYSSGAIVMKKVLTPV